MSTQFVFDYPLCCRKHNQLPKTFICFDPNCPEKGLICFACLQSFHKGHLFDDTPNFVYSIKDKIFECNIQSKIQKLFQLKQKLIVDQKQMHEQIEDIYKQLNSTVLNIYKNYNTQIDQVIEKYQKFQDIEKDLLFSQGEISSKQLEAFVKFSLDSISQDKLIKQHGKQQVKTQFCLENFSNIYNQICYQQSNIMQLRHQIAEIESKLQQLMMTEQQLIDNSNLHVNNFDITNSNLISSINKINQNNGSALQIIDNFRRIKMTQQKIFAHKNKITGICEITQHLNLRIASCSLDCYVKIFDSISLNELEKKNCYEALVGLCYIDKIDKLAVISVNNNILIFKTGPLLPIKTIKGNHYVHDINSKNINLQYIYNTNYLLNIIENKIIIWDIYKGQVKQIFEIQPQAFINQQIFLEDIMITSASHFYLDDQSYITYSDNQGNLYCVNMDNPQNKYVHKNAYQCQILFTKIFTKINYQSLISVGENNKIIEWSLPYLQQKYTWQLYNKVLGMFEMPGAIILKQNNNKNYDIIKQNIASQKLSIRIFCRQQTHQNELSLVQNTESPFVVSSQMRGIISTSKVINNKNYYGFIVQYY